MEEGWRDVLLNQGGEPGILDLASGRLGHSNAVPLQVFWVWLLAGFALDLGLCVIFLSRALYFARSVANGLSLANPPFEVWLDAARLCSDYLAPSWL